jgi:hypothetical protein
MGFGVSNEHQESTCTVLLFCQVQCISTTVTIFTACPLLLSKYTPGGLLQVLQSRIFDKFCLMGKNFLGIQEMFTL